MILPNVTHHFTFERDQWYDYPGDIESLSRIFEARLAHRFGEECRVRCDVLRSGVLKVSVLGPFGIMTTSIEADLQAVLQAVNVPALG